MVSVIIPAYNASAFIKDCINSILGQKYQDFEIVVVNDGSTDNTLEILKNFEKKDARVKVISQSNGGVSSARNTALKVAKGEYITYVDADDSLPKNALSDLVELMNDDVDLVVGSHYEIRFKKRPHLETITQYTTDDLDKRFIDFDSVIWWPWGKLFRKSIIDDNNLMYDTAMTFGEDHIFNLLYAKHITGKVVVSDKIVYNYHFIRGGLCSKFYQNMDEFQKYIYLKIADYFGGIEKVPEEYHLHYIASYITGCFEYYISWQTFSKAKKSLKNCIEIYDDLINDEILDKCFTRKQIQLIKSNNYGGFIVNYVLNNPKKTLWRKFKRTVRRILEFLQKVFIKKSN
jgi:glycosyltransferase involved in cell wall biosynthesis